jgi:drug/metabolite transporter (DMT)-like permease
MVEALERHTYTRGLALGAAGSILFSFDVLVARLSMADKWTLLFGRSLFLALAVFLIYLSSRAANRYSEDWRLTRADFGIIAANVVGNICFVGAITETSAANLAFILTLNPVFCAILGWALRSETLSPGTWLTIGLVTFGVILVCWDTIELGNTIGCLLALGAALSTAVALTLVRRTGRRQVTSAGFASLISAGIALFLAEPTSLALSGWGWLVLNGLILLPLASGLMATSSRLLPTPELSMLLLLDVVLIPVWVWLVLGEIPTALAAFGGVIAIGALVIHGTWRLAAGQREAIETKWNPWAPV